MTIEIHVPDIGADEVEVTEVLVKVGDKVTLDQSLLSVEGDKASMEVPAAQSGTVKEIKVKAGEGEGKLVFESASKPKTNSGTITELSKNKYQLIVKPNVEYVVSYKAI